MSKQKQILVFNAGSNSLKYKLFQREDLKVLKENDFQNIKKEDGHLNALRKALQEIGDLTDIKVIGHRIVHGGNKFCQPSVVNEKVVQGIKEFANEAPLHNPYQLKVLESAQNYFPDVIQVVVFDTAFFNTLPEKAKVYAIPLKYYQQGVQRFGFHGISHQYVAKKAAEKMKRKLSAINLITCHLGGGCSIAAIAKGEAIDTSMGFTPLEGLVMMTRPGDLDPGLAFHLNQDLGLSKEEIYDLFNFQSGIKGLFGKDDFKKLLSAVKRKDKKACLAFDIFVYRIQKYISTYVGILGDTQGVVFTGAIGSGNPYTVRKIKQGLPLLDKIEVLRIKTDEEKAIAEECQKFIF